MNTLSLLFSLLVLQAENLPETEMKQTLPLASTPVLGKVRTSDGLAFVNALVDLGEQLAPGVRKAFQRRDHPDKYRLTYSQRMVSVHLYPAGAVYDPWTGRLMRFGVGIGSGEPQLNVSVAECDRRARLFYRLAGGKYELGPGQPSFDNDDESLGQVHFFFEQLVPGESYPVGTPIECIFERTYGLVEIFMMSYPPEVERATRVVPSSDIAEAAAVAAQPITGWANVEVGVQKPRYRIPAFDGIPQAITERHKRLRSEKKACLVYEVSVNDAASYNATTKRFERFAQVYVDAETGKAIALLPTYKMRGEGAPTDSRVKIEGTRWTCGKGTGKLTRVEETAPERGVPMTLRSEKGAFLLALYSSRMNRLVVAHGGQTQVFEPDEKLATALQAYRPSAFVRQPKLKAGEPKGKGH